MYLDTKINEQRNKTKQLAHLLFSAVVVVYETIIISHTIMTRFQFEQRSSGYNGASRGKND